jgi:glycyl-tRNA synthetase
MLEMDGSIMTPAEVLKTSGHVDKFTDWMVKDKLKTSDIYRVDHLIKAELEARLEGDKQARAKLDVNVQPEKSKKKNNKDQMVKLEDSVKAEYEEILAQVNKSFLISIFLL